MRLPLLLLVTTALAPPAHATRAPAPDIAAMLDAYAGRDYAAALQPLERASPDEIGQYRQQLTTVAGTAWIERVPDDRARRTRQAAAFALEAEALLADRCLWTRGGSGENPCP
jgi:hypothetical protein